MKRLTVLHTIETAGPGGAETVLLQLATQLDPARFRSVAVLPEPRWLGRKLEEHGVPTFYAPSKGWHDFGSPRGLIRTIRGESVDLIHSHLPGQNFDGCLAGTLTGKKTIVTYHGPVEFEHASTWQQRIRLATVRNRAAAAVVVCDFVGGILRGLGFDPQKIVRIYNGVNVSLYGKDEPGGFRKELGLAPGTRLVGMIANVRASKGYEYYVRAARKVIDELQDVVFVGVGDIDENLAAPVRSLMSTLGLGDRFRLVGFRSDVPRILNDLDLVVLASTSEGMPLVTLEAMATGKALVVTRCGGAPEVVDDGHTGLVVPVADAEAMAEAIVQLLRDKDVRQMGACARERVTKEFSIQKMIRSYEELYLRVLGAN